MKRREFFTLIGCVAVAWPSTVRAQKRVPAVGILLFGGAADARDIGFVRELIRIGYVEGNNINYTVYAADGAYRSTTAACARDGSSKSGCHCWFRIARSARFGGSNKLYSDRDDSSRRSDCARLEQQHVQPEPKEFRRLHQFQLVACGQAA